MNNAHLHRADHIAAVRAFNRFYTREIGVLEKTLLQSKFSLVEARVLFEIANQPNPSAKEIGAQLGLDAGYLSRILQTLIEHGVVARKPSDADKRRLILSLTRKGQTAFDALERQSRADVGKMLDRLTDQNEKRLIEAMTDVRDLLSSHAPSPREAILRNHRPGDMGWVVQQHGALYAREFGWDISFEGMVADIVAKFLQEFDPKRERCWIAEMDGQQVGSVFLVKQSDEVAKLRLLIVDPSTRGLGLGKRLVDECIGFARECGYRKITLWTQSILIAARGIYESAGFQHIATEPHRSFGHDLIGETWELKL